MQPDLRMPPHSIAAEQSVLGAIFIRNDSLDRLDGVLTENDFYRADHRLIFAAMSALRQSNIPVDLVTVQDWLEARGQLADAGGIAYLGSIARDTPSAATVMSYAYIVRDASKARRLIAIGTQIAESGYETADVAAAVDDAQAAVMALSDSSVPEVTTMRDHLRGFVAELERRSEASGKLIGLSSGFADLDKITAGFRNSDLVILAARPSMGKTALALNFAESAAIHDDKSVVVISAEMSGAQLTERLVSSISQLPFENLRHGDLDQDGWRKITSATTRINSSKLLINDRSSPSLAQVRSFCRRVKREQGLDLIVVDYLQLMVGKGDNRTQEVGSLSRGLKALAKELDVPVIVLSQLNREVEKRHNKRPTLSDLRDSGEIEQDADLVLFLYRDEVYDPNSTRKGCAELIIAKHRNGSLGTVGLSTNLDRMRFEDLFGGLPELPKEETRRVVPVGFPRGRSRDHAAGND